jgi:predicted aconitase with swiveling domain
MSALATAKVLIAGEGQGEILRVSPPVSFWGGIDPGDGVIRDPRHPLHGQSIHGRVMITERVVGSSSGSSIVLELIAARRAPAALILCEPDCIATLGVVVASSMGYACFPVLLIDAPSAERLRGRLRIESTGAIYSC